MVTKELELASELRTVVTRLIKKMRRESVTAQHLSLTERSTLATLLNNGQMVPSELATSEKITNQSMSQILNKLWDLGYIDRIASEQDRRKILISLTEKGTHIIEQVRSERAAWLASAITATCSAEEQELLKKVIGPLTKLVDFE